MSAFSRFCVDFRRVFKNILYFQEIHQFSDNKNDLRNKGWIHKDGDSESDYELAGLIYLSPNIDPDSGTSLFNRKENAEEKIEETGREYKKLLYTYFLKNTLYYKIEIHNFS